MLINLIRIIIISVVIFHSTNGVFAQSSQSVGTTSTTTLDLPWRSILKKMSISYMNMSGVTPLDEEESEFEGKIDYDEAPASRMLNELGIGYRISEDVTASIVTVWSYNLAQRSGQDFQPLDPYLKVAFADVYEEGNFEYETDFRVGAAMSEESKESKRVVALGSQHEIEYLFGKSPFSFEMELYIQYNVQKTENDFDDLELRFEPALLYQISSKFYGRMSYESQMYHERSNEDLVLVDNEDPTLQSGIGWEASKNLNIYPFIDLNLSEPGTKNALYGAQIKWAVL